MKWLNAIIMVNQFLLIDKLLFYVKFSGKDKGLNYGPIKSVAKIKNLSKVAFSLDSVIRAVNLPLHGSDLLKDHLFVPAYRGDIVSSASKMLPNKIAHTMLYRPRARSFKKREIRL